MKHAHYNLILLASMKSNVSPVAHTTGYNRDVLHYLQ